MECQFNILINKLKTQYIILTNQNNLNMECQFNILINKLKTLTNMHGWFAMSHAQILEHRIEVGLCSCTI